MSRLTIEDDPMHLIWRDNYSKNTKILRNSNNVKTLSWLYNNDNNINKPVVIVGAGPSLDNNIELLNKNRRKFIIICVDAAYPALIDKKIYPDFVVVIDPIDHVSKYFECFYSKIIQNTYLVAPTTVNHTLLSNWIEQDGKAFIFSQSDDISFKDKFFKELNMGNNYPCLVNRSFVGYTAIQIASIIRAKRIIMVGMDFCFTGNRFYCDGTLRCKFGDDYITKNDELFEDFKIDSNNKEIRPNVWVSPLFRLYLYILSLSPEKYKRLYINCSHEYWSEVVNYSEFKDICEGTINEIDHKDNFWSSKRIKSKKKK